VWEKNPREVKKKKQKKKKRRRAPTPSLGGTKKICPSCTGEKAGVNEITSENPARDAVWGEEARKKVSRTTVYGKRIDENE